MGPPLFPPGGHSHLMPPPAPRADRFRYDGYTIEPGRGEIRCTYSTGGHTFTERYQFGPEGQWESPAVQAAARLLFLLAGVSYYKTTAAPVIDLGSTTSTADERAFLLEYYVHGLGEFAYQNGLDLRSLSIEGPDAPPATAPDYVPTPGRPLIPFGGGIDSLVTVAALGAAQLDAALCIVHPPGDRFAAIEDAAEATSLPVVRVAREIDPLVRRSRELGFLNGHVPITAVIAATAVVAAVLGQRDAVVLSNEQSASVPTLVHDGQPINHQWSKGLEFEQGFAQFVAASLGPNLSVFSYLRARSELWVAQQFAQLTRYHEVFRSCNRSFNQDPAQRLDRWCGTCDKCCFIDLILAPFMPADSLRHVFEGSEPLDHPELEHRFATLLGLAPEAKPFECVGDVDECRAALALAAARPDRQDTALLRSLAEAVTRAHGSSTAPPASLLVPAGPHYIPERYAPPDLLVRAH
jgi:UDP-N-acetyl-alpha-D-muramoyl-L-alanyl-L-glutamate epimerase